MDATEAAKWLILIGLGVAAAISLSRGFSNALQHSQDFQYSGAKLLSEGKNPYALWLSGEHGNDFLLSQAPNYCPLLLYLLRPIAAIDWVAAKCVWALLNVGFAICIGFQIARSQMKFNRYFAAMASLLFLSSLPVRNCIGNGQHSLLIGACMIGALRLTNRSILSSCLLAIAVTKYSIGAFLWATCAGFRRYQIVIGSALVTLVSFIAVSIETSTPVGGELFMSVLHVGDRGGVTFGPLFSQMKSDGGHLAILASACFGLLWCFFAVLFDGTKDAFDARWKLKAAAVSMSASLVFAPHLGYDSVIVVLPLAVGLVWSSLHWFDRAVYGVVLLYSWNLSKLCERLVGPDFQLAWDIAVHFVYLVILIRASRGFYSLSKWNAPQILRGSAIR